MFKRKDGIYGDAITINGKKRFFYAKSKAEVKKKVAAFRQEHGGSITLSDALDEWIEYKSTEVSYKTLEGYKSPVSRLLSAFGDKSMGDISPAQIQAFIRGLTAQGFKRSTIQRPLDVLRMVYDYEITQPHSGIESNPCAAVRLPSGLSQESRDLISRADADIIRANVNQDFGLFPFFIMYSGLRDGEALAITDADIHDGWIFVSKSVSWQSNQPVIKCPKTENGVRRVVLLRPLAEALPKWSGYLFSADGGKSPLSSTQFRHRWNAYCRAVGLAEFSTERHTTNGHTYERKVWKNRVVPYQLRHEFATLCFDAGLDAKATADFMGHAKEETTRRIYTHIQESRRLLDAEKLQDFVEKL